MTFAEAVALHLTNGGSVNDTAMVFSTSMSCDNGGDIPERLLELYTSVDKASKLLKETLPVVSMRTCSGRLELFVDL